MIVGEAIDCKSIAGGAIVGGAIDWEAINGGAIDCKLIISGAIVGGAIDWDVINCKLINCKLIVGGAIVGGAIDWVAIDGGAINCELIVGGAIINGVINWEANICELMSVSQDLVVLCKKTRKNNNQPSLVPSVMQEISHTFAQGKKSGNAVASTSVAPMPLHCPICYAGISSLLFFACSRWERGGSLLDNWRSAHLAKAGSR